VLDLGFAGGEDEALLIGHGPGGKQVDDGAVLIGPDGPVFGRDDGVGAAEGLATVADGTASLVFGDAGEASGRRPTTKRRLERSAELCVSLVRAW
jgi:hypothetical protein